MYRGGSTMFKKYICVMLIVVFVVYYVEALGLDSFYDCDSSSDSDLEFCLDHSDCCAGCCFNGECIDTFRSCMVSYDVCSTHICMGDQMCVPYVPPECPLCAPLPVCTGMILV